MSARRFRVVLFLDVPADTCLGNDRLVATLENPDMWDYSINGDTTGPAAKVTEIQLEEVTA